MNYALYKSSFLAAEWILRLTELTHIIPQYCIWNQLQPQSKIQYRDNGQMDVKISVGAAQDKLVG